ncbi:RNA polymerase sigma-70 factor (ECF subfamily) [Allocatelliglobosispora scoriae]|uniref:RNA polymerase sigma-70 factor (ECF subfamily) n=1 Tax=Allocatelliglobosispora scoriae TaxID=643052 RepID=A0A841BJ17_9ACTN|nr:sigma-70 family RNA polymerase sigma factor [Allocatelliglobosispora scoriae]MBB5868254.1 RNA polymerase sigma-70 factor (ECF subfamily) [Allocatelliglobosispora scoriae]
MTDLFRAHWSAVFGYVLRRTGDRVLAEELAQETFARATASFLGWRGGSPLAWLFAIARNVVTDHHRRGRPMVELEESLLPPDAFPDVEVETRDLLSRLPEQSRRLLELVYLDGFTHAEVAAMTGRSPAAVRTAVWRARDTLRALALEEKNDDR